MTVTVQDMRNPEIDPVRKYVESGEALDRAAREFAKHSGPESTTHERELFGQDLRTAAVKFTRARDAAEEDTYALTGSEVIAVAKMLEAVARPLAPPEREVADAFMARRDKLVSAIVAKVAARVNRVTVDRYSGAKADRPFAVLIDGVMLRDANGRRVRTFTTAEAASDAGERELVRRQNKEAANAR